MTEFEQGVLYAASVLVALHDEPTLAASIVCEAGLESADCTSLDDYEKKHLRKIQGERGVTLRGL